MYLRIVYRITSLYFSNSRKYYQEQSHHKCLRVFAFVLPVLPPCFVRLFQLHPSPHSSMIYHMVLFWFELSLIQWKKNRRKTRMIIAWWCMSRRRCNYLKQGINLKPVLAHGVSHPIRKTRRRFSLQYQNHMEMSCNQNKVMYTVTPERLFYSHVFISIPFL